jgi:hypothetical protein
VRRLRADSQSAPGRLRASFTPVLRPVREVQSLDWDRKGRVTPAWTASQEAWPGAEPGGDSPGESRSGAPEGERTSRIGLRRLRRLVCGARCAAVPSRRHGPDQLAPFGAPLPSAFYEGANFLGCSQTSGAHASRERDSPTLSPPAGRGSRIAPRNRVFYFAVAGFAAAIHAATTTRKPCGEGQQ